MPPERFVHCISNHDQTGNHAFGERLSHRILPTALRAAEVLFCLSPYTPMLFMGQEWAASTPFLFFTDHNPELGMLIIEGRREEFKHFAAFREPAAPRKNPEPAETEYVSRLEARLERAAPWPSRLDPGSLQDMLWPSAPATPHFGRRSRDTWSVEELALGIGALHLRAASAEWLVLFDLSGGHEGSLREEAVFQSSEAAWHVVLSSNEARFGGEGTCALDLSTMQANFTTPETIVLRRL